MLETRGYGGALLQFALQGIAANFDPGSTEDQKVLKMLLEIEDTLIGVGDLQDDFALIVARKPAESVRP